MNRHHIQNSRFDEGRGRGLSDSNNLAADGIVGPKTVAALNALLPESGEVPEAPSDLAKPQVKVTGGSVYLRTLPSTSGAIRAVVYLGDLMESAGNVVNGWLPVVRGGEVCYITEKYAEISST